MSNSNTEQTKIATNPTTSPAAPQPADSDLQSFKAAVLARSGAILKDLRDGYPAAGAAEALLLRLASGDAANFLELYECNASLISVYRSSLLRDPALAVAANRMACDLQPMMHALRSRAQQSLTAATTIMATARITGARDRDGDQ